MAATSFELAPENSPHFRTLTARLGINRTCPSNSSSPLPVTPVKRAASVGAIESARFTWSGEPRGKPGTDNAVGLADTLRGRGLASVTDTAAQKEMQFLKDENNSLHKQIRMLQQEVEDRASAQVHQSRALREAQDERTLRVNSLQQDLDLSEARLRKALSELLTAQKAEAHQRLQRSELEELLKDRTSELNRVKSESFDAEHDFAGQLEYLRRQCKDLMKEAQDVKQQERFQRERAVSTCHAQVEALQHQFKDEQRSAALKHEHLEEQRRGLASSEASRSQMVRELAECQDLQKDDRARFNNEIRDLEASAETTYRLMFTELEQAKAHADALQAVIAQKDAQLHDQRAEVACVEMSRDEAMLKHGELLRDMKLKDIVMDDLHQNLSAARAERDEGLRRFGEHRVVAEGDFDRAERCASLSKSELNDAQRRLVDTAAALDGSEKRFVVAEERWRASLADVEKHNRMAHDSMHHRISELTQDLVRSEKHRDDLQWQVKDHVDKGDQLQRAHEAESQRTKTEVLQERSVAHAQSKADSKRIEDLEGEIAKLKVQSAEIQRRHTMLDSLHDGLREHTLVLGRSIHVTAR
eukprot:TRINITY_DN57734_c0_g1_i1.p1 TRINITY_DN57734_c0_g1~~TRINITY_DN57734_c0_g1_i1.p1  ORF type:complete len:662 (-),score=112.29 TRINITY_DN57734_c0_g1_i1:122-1879(-)